MKALSDRLDISLEATMRHYVEQSLEPIAAIWTQHGIIRYFAAGKKFPKLSRTAGDMILPVAPAGCAIGDGRCGTTKMVEADGTAWIRSPDFGLFEQTRVGKDGRALTLLWATLPDVDDDGVF